jgi:uncharacterized protein (TIGR02444 family)
MSLWTWTLAAYDHPGARDACLELQDSHGQNVCLLLWAVWAEGADPACLVRAVEAARVWEGSLIGPLREARQGLKTIAQTGDGLACEGLRQDVKALELQAERLLLEALEAVTGSRRVGSATPIEALRAAADAWGGEVPQEALSNLAAALDLGLIRGGDGRHDGRGQRGSGARMDDDAAEWEQGLRQRLAVLTQEHADLDVAIQALALSPLPDIQVVGRLKRKKLALKDEIARINDQLTPDIIA